MYYYHVISDIPKRAGERLRLGEGHPNRVYARVQAEATTVEEIYRHPEKYAGAELSHEVKVALRETALEKVRRARYPQYPSRMAALYVSATLEEAARWGEYFAGLGRPTYGIARVRAEGRRFEGDAEKCFDGVVWERENLRMAEEYWRNEPRKDGRAPIKEIIIDGEIEIVEIVKRINIRRANAGDLARIAEILIFNYRMYFYPIFRDDEFYFAELNVPDVMEWFREAPEKNWVYDDGAVKGFIQLEGSEVKRLYVEPVLHGAGIGAELLEYAVSAHGADHLWALEKNERAIAFYARHGFKPTGERKPEDGTDEYLVLLRREHGR